MCKPVWQVPYGFPSRDHLFFNQGITDRQLWAIGAVVCQWSMTELLLQNAALELLDRQEFERFMALKGFRNKLKTFEGGIESNLKDGSERTGWLRVIVEMRRLNDQRDKIVHKPWGGGMEASSWSAAGEPQADGRMIKTKARDANWSLDFRDLKRIGEEISRLNAVIGMRLMGPDRAAVFADLR